MRGRAAAAAALAALATALGGSGAAQAQTRASCDSIDPARCLFPWPNDYFTTPDAGTDTGRRLDLALDAMPRNAAGKPIDPADYNRNDGFSPGQLIVTKVPGLDTPEAFRRTGAVPITDIERTYDPNQPIVVLNTRTGKRHLIWSELDANPTNPRDVALLIRPAVNFEEGTRYIVALRNLKDADGRTIAAGEGFRHYRDRKRTNDPVVEARRSHFESIFKTLGRAGIERKELFLAWDFTVASERNLSERLLHIRDDGFAQLGDRNLADLTVEGAPPAFVVTDQRDFAPCGGDGCQDGESDTLARRVEGRMSVPCYLNAPGCPPGSRFAFASGSDHTPMRLPGNTTLANFICNIPRSAVDGPGVTPARPSLYGHGLLGSAGEVGAGNVQAMGNEHNFVFCATDWTGMSSQDIPTIGTILADLSGFPMLADRAQQGMLNFLYLGRAMVHPDGFSANPAFRFDDDTGGAQSVIDTTRLFYDGNSQGGIMGGALAAVAVDHDRAVLGVPGMNYSTLLRRSVDFDEYSVVMYRAYPDELERPLILSMIQMLWDRGEANGYAHHMTDDPPPNTPPHEVLLHPAFGDHQVANVSTEVEARTIGASIHQPALAPGRHTDVNPYFGIPAISSYPFAGSAFVMWDSGSPPPPTSNTPPRDGRDPHGDPRAEPAARLQKSEFLKVDGTVRDVCAAGPCFARGYAGP